MNLTLTQFKEQSSKLFADDPLDDTNGNVGSPKWSGALDVNYTLKNWNVFYSTEYIGKTSSYSYYEEDPATSRFKLDTPAYFLHSLSLTYKDTVSKWKATVGVRNIADKKPPVVVAAIAREMAAFLWAIGREVAPP